MEKVNEEEGVEEVVLVVEEEIGITITIIITTIVII
jgi:hypothetical protein